MIVLIVAFCYVCCGRFFSELMVFSMALIVYKGVFEAYLQNNPFFIHFDDTRPNRPFPSNTDSIHIFRTPSRKQMCEMKILEKMQSFKNLFAIFFTIAL